MSYTYEEAIKRSELLRPVVPAPWRITTRGNTEDGYVLTVSRGNPGESLDLDGDNDVAKLVTTYIDVVERMVGESS